MQPPVDSWGSTFQKKKENSKWKRTEGGAYRVDSRHSKEAGVLEQNAQGEEWQGVNEVREQKSSHVNESQRDWGNQTGYDFIEH